MTERPAGRDDAARLREMIRGSGYWNMHTQGDLLVQHLVAQGVRVRPERGAFLSALDGDV